MGRRLKIAIIRKDDSYDSIYSILPKKHYGDLRIDPNEREVILDSVNTEDEQAITRVGEFNNHDLFVRAIIYIIVAWKTYKGRESNEDSRCILRDA